MSERNYTPAPIPHDEPKRLEDLRLLGLLDTVKEERFDRYTQLVADLFDVPIALITLVDENRQWFKSSCGLAVAETTRDISFCGHAILESRLLVIPDAAADPSFAGNPLVTGEPHIRFYAGAVLRSENGRALGTLCLIDHRARPFSQREQARLLAIAAMVEQEVRHESRLQIERKKAYENAHYDQGTGLPNARLFEDRVEQALMIMRRSPGRLLVALIEFVGWIDIKSALGAAAANELLRAYAERLNAALSDLCTLARWRENTFSLLLPALSRADEEVALTEHVQKVLTQPVTVQGRTISSDIRIGAALYPEAGLSVDELLENARLAAHECTRQTHKSWSIYSPAMGVAMTRRIDLEHYLAEAIRQDRLSVVYQPIIDLDAGRIRGVEALCRWNDPRLGQVDAEEFVGVAEMNDSLITALDRFVLRQSVTQILEWDRAGWRALTLSVNLSSKSLVHPQLIGWLDEAVSERGLDPRRVVLEVTENSLVADIGLARRNTAECRQRGFAVAIDDFGTGFSSFNYLKDLAVDELKLDKVFIKEMAQRRSDASIASTIIALAHKLGLTVVAEGIETAEQLTYLRAYHCDQGQGYYFAAPMSSDAVAARIAAEAAR